MFFDPIGPFRMPTLSRFKYALVVMDDFSGLIHLRMMVRLNEWFHHLTALIKRIEAEKGSERVIAQIGSDSFPAFVNGTQSWSSRQVEGFSFWRAPRIPRN